MKTEWQKAQGFTLIEVLVAVTIVAMIFAMVFATFFYTVNNAERQEEQAAVYHKAGFILNNIAQNVSSAYIPFGGKYGSEPAAGEDTELIKDTEDEEPVFLGEASLSDENPVDKLSMFTTNPRFGAPALAGEIAHVTYDLAEDESTGFSADTVNPTVMKCAVDPLLSRNGDEGGGQQWTLNIRSLKFEYYDGETWASDWDYSETKALPAAVKIMLEIADPDGDPHTFSTIAYVPVNTTLEDLEQLEGQGAATEEKADESDKEGKEGADSGGSEQNSGGSNQGEAGHGGQGNWPDIKPPPGKPDTFGDLLQQKG